MIEAEILATGSELLTPDRVDTNSLWLTEQLDGVGVPVRRKTVVGDDLPRLREAMEDALRRSGLVLCTGGLGPTEDDVTREAAAGATGRELRFSAEVADELRRRFEERGIAMAENNLRQARVPQGGEVLANRVGTAPGLRLVHGGSVLVLLPGPPREMRPMFTEHVLPTLAGGPRTVRRVLKVTGLPESTMDQMVAPVCRRHPEVAVTVNFTAYDLEIRLSTREGSLEPLEAELAEVLGASLFSRQGETLEAVVRRLLGGDTLAVGEVASAGRVAARVGPLAGVVAARPMPLLDPWPADEATARLAADRLRESTGADLALVVGEARLEGERASAPVAVSGGPAATVTLPVAEDLLARRASQAALDLLRRHLWNRSG